METRYHINPDTGKPNICRSTGKLGCRYAVDGKEPPHYGSKEEARAGYEKDQEVNLIPTPMRAVPTVDPLPSSMSMLSSLTTAPREITLEDLGEEDEELEALLRELDEMEGEIYPGKLSTATTMDEKLHQYRELSTALVMENIDPLDGTYEPPVNNFEEFYDEETGEEWSVETSPAPPGFKFLGAGASNNAYLHASTGMVYKIPNAEGVAAMWNENSSGLQREMVVLEQKAYALLDHRALDEMNMEYVETTFLQVKDPSGLSVPVIVQPHLSLEEYSHAELDNDTIRSIREAGHPLDDLRSVNVYEHRETGRLVMFDCLYLPLDVNI